MIGDQDEAIVPESTKACIVKAAIAFIDRVNSGAMRWTGCESDLSEQLVDLQKAVSTYRKKYNKNFEEELVQHHCRRIRMSLSWGHVTRVVNRCTKCGAEGETLVKWKEAKP